MGSSVTVLRENDVYEGVYFGIRTCMHRGGYELFGLQVVCSEEKVLRCEIKLF